MNRLNCPLGVCSGDTHLIAPDGGLRHSKPYLVPELQRLGWRRVDNPKRNYYHEYDRANPSYKNEQVDGIEDSDILSVTKL